MLPYLVQLLVAKRFGELEDGKKPKFEENP